MNRRGFIATIAAAFAPKPTTTLSAAGPACSTVAFVPSLPAGYDAAMSEAFLRRYLTPTAVKWAGGIEAHLAKRMRVRFDPARLPL